MAETREEHGSMSVHAQSASQIRRHASLVHAHGPIIDRLLQDPKVTDIMLNADGTLWCEAHGRGRTKVGELSLGSAESFIRLVASHMGTEATREHPTVSGVLPGTNARFQGMLPPVSQGPVFAIRKPARFVLSFDDFVHDKIISQRVAHALREAIDGRENLLIAGATGSGKTTFANACLAEPSFCRDRIVLIEDTRELQCPAPDRVELVASTAPAGTSMEELLRATLRLFPGRIVIGEVRGSEALTMIKAWGTGHPGGLCTIHANGPHHVLERLEELIGEVAVTIPRRTIARAIGLIVFIQRDEHHPAGRRVTGVTRPSFTNDGEYKFEDLEM